MPCLQTCLTEDSGFFHSSVHLRSRGGTEGDHSYLLTWFSFPSTPPPPWWMTTGAALSAFVRTRAQDGWLTILLLGGKKFPGSCTSYLQRALKAPESEKISQNWLLSDDQELRDRRKGKKRKIEAVKQNVRITTKDDDFKTGLRDKWEARHSTKNCSH